MFKNKIDYSTNWYPFPPLDLCILWTLIWTLFDIFLSKFMWMITVNIWRYCMLFCHNTTRKKTAARIDHRHLHTGQLSCNFCWQVTSLRPVTWDPDYTPGVDFFLILKNSHQDLSNEGSNFILSLIEVGHWVAQT